MTTVTGPTQSVDLLVRNAIVVTMDSQRRIFEDGALVIIKDRIVDVGKTVDLQARYSAKSTIDARRFVVTPGLVNCHIHITGEPLTRGYVPDDVDFAVHVYSWLAPMHRFFTPQDERLSAQLAALEMLRSGTTSFIEAVSISALDVVADVLNEICIRGRIGLRVWDQAMTRSHDTRTTDDAIRMLSDELSRYPSRSDARIAAWPTLVGHSLCSDTLWQEAKRLSVNHGTGMTFHMSPMARDGEWHFEKFGCRPI